MSRTACLCRNASRPILLLPLALFVASSSVGCGSRGLGADGPADGGAGDGRVIVPPKNDAAIPLGACDPMDARLPPHVRCGDPTPIGWMWNGAACHGIPCACEGADCDSLYASESRCMAARAPHCLPPPRCLGLDYQECLERPGCEVEYYGGGCMNLDDCKQEGRPGEEQVICWGQGFYCFPIHEACNERGQWDCNGDCYYWEWSKSLCLAGPDRPECCVTEGYGFCTSLHPLTGSDHKQSTFSLPSPISL